MNWTNIWAGIGTLAFVGVVAIGIYAGFQDHRVKFYFMGDHGNGMSNNGYCIDGYIGTGGRMTKAFSAPMRYKKLCPFSSR